MNAQRVLITGAGGYIGQAVVKTFLSRGYSVVALYRRRGASIDARARLVEGSMTDVESLERATVGVNAVVHLAAAKSDEPESEAVNIGGARNLIAACRKNGVRRIVVMSTASVKLSQKGRYGTTKAAADDLFRASGLAVTILRPSIVYSETQSGVFASLCSFARLPVAPSMGDGTTRFWPVHLGDLADLTVRVLEQHVAEGKTYDVGGPDTVSFDDLVRYVGTELYETAPYLVHVPAPLCVAIARMCSFLSKPPITISNVLAAIQQIPWEPEPLKRDTGFAPRSFQDGLRAIRTGLSEQEPEVLWRYIYQTAEPHPRQLEVPRKLYFTALASNDIPGGMHPLLIRRPSLIAPCEVASKLLRIGSNLERRILIASALVECDKASATWLLPRKRTRFEIVRQTAWLMVGAFGSSVLGLVFLVSPGFVRRYAR